MSQVLVLNASFEPIHIVSWQRGIQLLFQGKVEVLEESDFEIRTVRLTIKAPAVLRLLKYVKGTGAKDMIRFSRTNVFLRDRFTCQYCGKKHNKSHLTLDHVTPVVQSGRKSWDNIVTACKPCNQRKGGRTPQEANMHLIRKPTKPNWLPATHIRFGVTRTPQKWHVYLKFVNEDDLDDDGQ